MCIVREGACYCAPAQHRGGRRAREKSCECGERRGSRDGKGGDSRWEGGRDHAEAGSADGEGARNCARVGEGGAQYDALPTATLECGYLFASGRTCSTLFNVGLIVSQFAVYGGYRADACVRVCVCVCVCACVCVCVLRMVCRQVGHHGTRRKGRKARPLSRPRYHNRSCKHTGTPSDAWKCVCAVRRATCMNESFAWLCHFWHCTCVYRVTHLTRHSNKCRVRH